MDGRGDGSGAAHSASLINPDAGHHPVPTDPRELQAALRAGDLCWAHFPYYALRWSERGLRFARSDAAWLATLCDLPEAATVQQVRWLARLLASRGMPSLLLQVQLEMLADALSAAVPERRAGCERLLAAAEALRAGRCRHLSDEQAQDIARRFDQTVGRTFAAACPHTALLLCAAVADACEGMPRAVESLHGWLVDPARFSAPWIAAVDAALAEAHAAVRASGAADGRSTPDNGSTSP